VAREKREGGNRKERRENFRGGIRLEELYGKSEDGGTEELEGGAPRKKTGKRGD